MFHLSYENSFFILNSNSFDLFLNFFTQNSKCVHLLMTYNLLSQNIREKKVFYCSKI